MKFQNGLISRHDDYEYIDRFIDFLERIINIIVKLFSKLGGNKEEATSPTDAKTSTDA